jgi:D-glucosaminate-6-phosphate ammonia-lyase
MTSEDAFRLYADLGVNPVINAAGAYTVLGGSALSPKVQRAMDAANRYFVEMKELLEVSGRTIAGLLECEAAYVTSGAAGALALAAAACMTGLDTDKMERLPDPAGMKHEILVQRCLRTKYDRCVTVSGANLVEIGDESGTAVDQLEAAIGPRTLAVHFLAPGDRAGVLPLPEVIRVAHAHSIPVIVDAAGQTYPLDNLRKYTRLGADLVAYAGKYFDAPHSTGILCGRRDLVEAAAMNGFIGFETSGYRTFGRPMKLDRQEIVAVVVALREWFALNHEERFLKYGERTDVILRELQGLPNVEAHRISERTAPPPVVREGINVVINAAGLGKDAAQVASELREATPAVWVTAGDATLTVSVAFFNDGEEKIVAERLRSALAP